MDTVTLGNHTAIPVVAQRHARLRHKLGRDDFQKIMTADYASESYRVLSVLIPAICQKNKDGEAMIPLWEWEGFESQEAMDKDDYIEELDASPTTAQIVNAFEVALMVAGANRLGKLMGLMQAGADLTNVQQTQMPSLPGTPGENGASVLTGTGAQSPT